MNGLDVRVEFLGGPLIRPESLEAWEWFKGKVLDLELGEAFRFLGPILPSTASDFFSRVNVILEPAMPGKDIPFLSFARIALDSGKRVIAASTPSTEELKKSYNNLTLYEPGNHESLLVALESLYKE